MYRLTLAIAFATFAVASQALAAPLEIESPIGFPGQTIALTDHGPGWVHVLLGGNLDVTPPQRVLIQDSEPDRLWAEELADPNARHSFWMEASALTRFTIFNPTRPSGHDHQSFIGELGGPPVLNQFQLATTWELVGGEVVDFGDGVVKQKWTSTVDGGAPELRDVSLAPEPAGWWLALCGCLPLRRRR